MDALIEEQLSKEQPPPKPDAQELAEADNDTSEGDDTITMAMALLVIENTHLRDNPQSARHHLQTDRSQVPLNQRFNDKPISRRYDIPMK